MRRVVALTGAEARDAVTHAKELSEKLRTLDSLSGPELETQTTAFKIVNLFALCTQNNANLARKPSRLVFVLRRPPYLRKPG